VWQIAESKDAQKSLPKLPLHVRRKYELWKNVVRHSGPLALRDIPGFHDEALAGVWDGFRSSRLNDQYRVVYTIVRDELRVDVARVTAHDYRR
jgi:addiction module RelE/StbE family toxin